jgi:hypothetical protein
VRAIYSTPLLNLGEPELELSIIDLVKEKVQCLADHGGPVNVRPVKFGFQASLLIGPHEDVNWTIMPLRLRVRLLAHVSNCKYS